MIMDNRVRYLDHMASSVGCVLQIMADGLYAITFRRPNTAPQLSLKSLHSIILFITKCVCKCHAIKRKHDLFWTG